MTRLLFALLTVTLAIAPAGAAGRLADVSIVDRQTGAALPLYYGRGSYWVAGVPGARYAIAIRNQLDERVLAVTAVDGVNVVSGETASVGQTGYVFAARQRYEITGWRKSDAEIAAFEFTAAALSYAERTGRPANVGVIGVALFRERLPRSAPPAVADPGEPHANRVEPYSNRAEGGNAGTPAAALRVPGALADRARESLSEAPKLGTGHGEREYSLVAHTNFERAAPNPQEIIRIRYDSYEHLVALGIIPRSTPSLPDAFPGGTTSGYVPDPPG
jgi:hypothetical protein